MSDPPPVPGSAVIRRRLQAPLRGVANAVLIFTTALSLPAAVRAQGSPKPEQAQQASPLTLEQAVNIALEKNPQRKVALADTRAASAGIEEAKSNVLPHVSFNESVTRSDDPVYVFGSKLRQQRFTAADFGLNVLNTPLPYGNFGTRLDANWNLFDSFASWHGISRAERMKEAAGHQLERANQEIIFRVVDSYYRVLLAQKQLEVAEQSMKTAQAILERSKNRFESGVVVESDYLSARVRVATRKEEAIRAQNDLAFSRAQLAIGIGLPAGTECSPTQTLAEKILPTPSLEDAEKQALRMRPDLNSLRSQDAAQQQSVATAKSSFGPRISAFADWGADNPTFVGGGGGNNWTAGIQLQLDLFSGGAKRAKLLRERALEQKIAATKEMATDEIGLEVRRAYYDVASAGQQIDVARASIAESHEGLRINQNRYDSGLATITDLLVAEDAARLSQMDYWQAIYRYYTSYASLQLASGTLNPQSPVVTP
jgi:outer membrane protein